MKGDYKMAQDLTQYVDTLFANMKSFSQVDGLIGKPVIQGDKTFLPVISITLGYGGGDSQSKGKQGANVASGNMMGDAMGVGAKLCTDAVLVIDKDNVLLAPIGTKGNVSQMIDKVPQIISNMNAGGQQAGQQAGQQQQQKNQNQGF
jgi:uncharacterized spore protein YtfJ